MANRDVASIDQPGRIVECAVLGEQCVDHITGKVADAETDWIALLVNADGGTRWYNLDHIIAIRVRERHQGLCPVRAPRMRDSCHTNHYLSRITGYADGYSTFPETISAG